MFLRLLCDCWASVLTKVIPVLVASFSGSDCVLESEERRRERVAAIVSAAVSWIWSSITLKKRFET